LAEPLSAWEKKIGMRGAIIIIIITIIEENLSGIMSEQ
jgi:hypothetical protein